MQRRLTAWLVAEGHEVVDAGSAAALRELVASACFDLVVLGLPLPGEDGLALVRHLRAHTSVGIMLLGSKATAAERALGLEVGADDYLTGALDWREVLARVNSVLRRVHGPPLGRPSRSAARFAGWRLDPLKRELVSATGELVPITGSELDLLLALVLAPEQVIARERLLEMVTGRVWTPDDRTVDQHVSRLRHKLEAQPRNPRMIKTIRGRGYVLATAVEWD